MSSFSDFTQPPKTLQEMKERAELLKKAGHSCAMIIGMSNHTFEWCQQEICPKTLQRQNMAEREAKQKEFRADLKTKGHTCIRIRESYPTQTSWCQNEQCTGL